MRPQTKLAFTLALSALIASCSLEVPKPRSGASLSIFLKENSSQAVLDHLLYSATPSSGFGVLAAGDPSSASDFNCFAVNVTGEGIAANAEKLAGCTSANNFTGRGIGIISDEVPRGSSIELDVPSGRERFIDVYGVFPSKCGTTTGASGSSGDGAGYFLGRAVKDIGENTSVTIGISLTSDSIANKVTCPKSGSSGSTTNWVYASGSGQIMAMKFINNTGSLTDIGTTQFNAVTKLAASKDGKWLLAIDSTTTLNAYPINTTTGTLGGVVGSSWSGSGPTRLAVSAGGGLVFGLAGAGALRADYFNTTTGAATVATGSTIPSTANDIVVSPTHEIGFSNDGTKIYSYTINIGTGVWTDASSSSTGASPGQIAVHPSGNFVYMLVSSAVHAFSVNTSNGALTAVSGSPYSLAGIGAGLAFALDGKYLYALDQTDAVNGFTVNTSTGQLTAISGSPCSGGDPCNSGGGGAAGIAVAGTYILVSNSSTNDITILPIENATGRMSTAFSHSMPFAPGKLAIVSGP